MTGPAPVRLRARTRDIDPLDDLFTATDASQPLIWSRRGNGMVGYGQVWRVDVTAQPGTSRAEQLSRAWARLIAAADVDDPVNLPGTGLIAFGASTFDEDSRQPSTLIVPQITVGRRDGRAWVTRVWSADEAAPPDGAENPTRALGPHWSATLGPGSLDHEHYLAAVAAAVSAIEAGTLAKVVLARDVRGSAPAGADLRHLAVSLAGTYPDCWTFAVDGLIGASPETLVTVSHGALTARVLAGTAVRGTDAHADTNAAVDLATSEKDLQEHAFAVHSVLTALQPLTENLTANERPFTLELPNLWHLATDVSGRVALQASVLDLVAAMHPTAAVAGTPTGPAIEQIRRQEPFDRGRYAGPVGWVDARGDGEWAIALRCAQFGQTPSADGKIPVVAHAGAGIVAGSDPESELIETRVKFRPIVDALA